MSYQNFVIIVLLCIIFIILFHTMSYLFETHIEAFSPEESNYPLTGLSPEKSNSPLSMNIQLDTELMSSPSIENIFSQSNMIDASNMRIRLDRISEILQKLDDLRTQVYSNNQMLKITYEYKEPSESINNLREQTEFYKEDYNKYQPSEIYDINISGKPLNQIIHVDVPIGKKGILGMKGIQGNKGPTGEPGDVGPVGFCGLSIC